jgi:hypothetical protein
MPPALPLPPHPAHRLRFVQRGLRSMAVGLLVVLVLTAVYHREVWPTFVYTMAITVSCWFFIDGGRLVAARWLHRHDPDRGRDARWPGGAWMAVVVVAGTAIGYTLGNAAGNWITGHHHPGLIDVGSVQQALALLVIALMPGIAVTYVFYSRERLATAEATAQSAMRQAAENQLKLLESQLEPHMLFNTLANLRVLIGLDPPRAQAMLDRLIGFLRATLDASRSGSHSLAGEFARLADYLELMKIRMGDRLQAELRLPPELAELPVPPLLLQPLVENAIKHGLEPHVEGGRLVVSAAREGDALVLRVRDTGSGLSVLPGASGEGTRFGLQQVRDRLAALHGAQASLALDAAADAEGGTIATVRLPASGSRDAPIDVPLACPPR